MSDLVNIAVPLGTAVIAAGAALVGIATGGRNEHDAWIREHRRAAYLRMLEEAEGCHQGELPASPALLSAHLEVSLLGPDRVTDVAHDLQTAVNNLASAAGDEAHFQAHSHYGFTLGRFVATCNAALVKPRARRRRGRPYRFRAAGHGSHRLTTASNAGGDEHHDGPPSTHL